MGGTDGEHYGKSLVDAFDILVCVPLSLNLPLESDDALQEHCLTVRFRFFSTLSEAVWEPKDT